MAEAGKELEVGPVLTATLRSAVRVDARVALLAAAWVGVSLLLYALFLVAAAGPAALADPSGSAVTVLAVFGVAGFAVYWSFGFLLLRTYLARHQPDKLGPATAGAFARYFGRVVALLLGAGLAAAAVGLVLGVPAASLAEAQPTLGALLGLVAGVLSVGVALIIYVRLIPWFAGAARNGAAAPPAIARRGRPALVLLLAALLVFVLAGTIGIVIGFLAGIIDGGIGPATAVADSLSSLVGLVLIHAFEAAVVACTDTEAGAAEEAGAAHEGGGETAGESG